MPSNKKTYEKPIAMSIGKVANTLGQTQPLGMCGIGTSPSAADICDAGADPLECTTGAQVGPWPGIVCNNGANAIDGCQIGNSAANGPCSFGGTASS